MAVLVITDGKIYIDGYNLSCSFNELNVDVSAEMKDTTTFCTSGTRAFIPGLQGVSFSGKALQDFDGSVNQSIEKTTWDLIGKTTASIMSVAREGNAMGDVAYTFKGVTAQIQPVQGTVGDLAEISISGQSSVTRLVRGIVGAVGTKTSTGNGTAYNLGAVLTGQRVYAAMHVVRPVTTGTLDMIVESDDNGSFTTPTTRLTFTQVTNAIGAQWITAAGPIADTWWRAKWTVGSGSFPVFVVIGIL